MEGEQLKEQEPGEPQAGPPAPQAPEPEPEKTPMQITIAGMDISKVEKLVQHRAVILKCLKLTRGEGGFGVSITMRDTDQINQLISVLEEKA